MRLSKITKIVVKYLKRFPSVDSFLQIRKRAHLAEGSGYPQWKSLFAEKISTSRVVERGSPIRVLIATSTGAHLPAMHVESMLAVALSLRGAHVESLLCDGVLPCCQLCEPRIFPNLDRFTKDGPSKVLCKICFGPGQRCYQEAKINSRSFSEGLTKEDYAIANRISESLKFEEISTYCYGGINVGEHAMSGSLRYFARAALDSQSVSRVVLRRYLKSAILTVISIDKILSKNKFDVVVCHHGIYVPQGIVGAVARRKNIRVVTWNPAYRNNSFIFSHNDTYHHTLMTEPTSIWQEMVWSESKELQIDSYLRSRWIGDQDWIKFHRDPICDQDKILEEIGVNKKIPIIGCLTNVMWDAQLHYPSNAFNNMLEWIEYTVKYFIQRPDLQLVIRVHPAEINGSVPTRQPVADELKRIFGTLPKNVFLVNGDSKISTYALARACDAVVIYGTKTGVELASTGIPIIVAGEAWVRGKGFTIDVNSPEHYNTVLDNLPIRVRMSREKTLLAKKYAYHFFFRRMIPINLFKKGPGWPPYEFSGTIDQLYPGGDKGLDCVCEGILEGEEFVFSGMTAERK